MDITRPHATTAHLRAEDFLPAMPLDREGLSAGDSAGYWLQVWQRLAINRRAMLALAIIVLLLLFTLLGPTIWRVDANMQSPGLASEGPMLAQTVPVIIPDQWQPAPPMDLKAIDVVAASTERVRLQWAPVPSATQYRVYRNEHQPTNAFDLGVPLAGVAVSRFGYEDGLALKPRPYYYSVLAVMPDGGERSLGTVEVTPRRAIGFLQAQLQGLVPDNARAHEYADATVTLPAHPLGTDALGRDMLARLMVGAQTSLFIGIVAPLLAIGFGILFGAVSGYVGGWVDSVMMRFAEFVIALPFLLFMILLKVVFGIGPGESGIVPMLVAMVILSWPSSARLVRGQVLQLREQPYVEAARLFGGGSAYLIIRHMLPNVLGVVLVALSFAIPSAIFTEAFLSFIGLGVVPPTPSWGSLSNDGMKTLRSYPMGLLWPSLFISITVLSFNLFGDALRDALDTRLERR